MEALYAGSVECQSFSTQIEHGSGNIHSGLKPGQWVQQNDLRCMLDNQNGWSIMWLASFTGSDFLTCILENSPMTVVMWTVVDLQLRGLGPPVPGRVPGLTSKMVDHQDSAQGAINVEVQV